jgi:hypothetical protein
LGPVSKLIPKEGEIVADNEERGNLSSWDFFVAKEHL